LDRLKGDDVLDTTYVEADEQGHKLRKPVRPGLGRVYLGTAVLLVLQVIFQVFMAGAGIFAGGSWFAFHGLNGALILLVALMFLITGLFARLPRSMNWCGALLILLVIVQSLLIYPPRKWGMPLLSALHPVNALFIFLLPLYLAIRVRQILRVSAANGR
jgi:hypothetical protein